MTSKRSKEFQVISSTQSYTQFIETTVNKISETFNWLRFQLIIRRLDDKQLTVKLDLLEKKLIDLTYASTLYYFNGTPINGFTSLIDHYLLFFNYLERKNYITSVESIDDLEVVIDLFINETEVLNNFHGKQISETPSTNTNSLELITKDNQLIRQCILSHGYDSEPMKILNTNFLGFWINGYTYKWIKLLEYSITFSGTPFPKCFKALSDKKFRRFQSYRLMMTGTAEFPLQLIRFIDTHISRKVLRGLLYRNSRVNSKTFYVKRQGQWTISSKGRNVFKSIPEISDKLPLRFRLHQNRRTKVQSSTLIFFCHGGGFIVTRSEFHELYLKKWAHELGDVSVLCLDYSQQAPYPIVFQEFLDAYLWVTSGSQDVVDKIGFHPKKIIVSGESAGGVIGMALLTCLSQIETLDPTLSILYPSDMVFFYGAFMCCDYACPSRLLIFHDVILCPGILATMLGCITDIQGGIRPKPRPANRIIRAFKYFAEDFKNFKMLIRGRKTEEAWFIKNGQYDCDKFLQQLHSVEDTFYNSLGGFDYDKFSKINLYLITTNRCCFVDDNVELAKSWKGHVELHCVKGSVHGFLMVPGEKEIVQFAANLFKKAVNENRL